MGKNFNGFAYPVTKNAKGYFRNQSDIDQIKSDLIILLLTNPGERVFLPNFGTPLRTLIFEPNDTTLQSQARQMIINSIARWEPRIAIDQVQVSSTVSSSDLNSNDDLTQLGSILMIKISFFDPDNIQSVQDLVLNVPLGTPS